MVIKLSKSEEVDIHESIISNIHLVKMIEKQDVDTKIDLKAKNTFANMRKRDVWIITFSFSQDMYYHCSKDVLESRGKNSFISRHR